MPTGNSLGWQGNALKAMFTLKYFLGEDRVNSWLGSLNASLVHGLESRLKKNGKGFVRPVSVETNIDLNRFKEQYQSKNRPVVLKGAASHWNCVRNWDFEFLSSRYGEDAVTLLNPTGLGQSEIDTTVEDSSLSEFIEHIQNGGRKYLRFHPFLMEHPELLEDLDQEWIRDIQTRGVLRPEYQMFIGPQGSHTPVHAAMPCNVFIQVHGRKRWLLFEPNEFPLLNPNPSGLSYYTSDVDPASVDRERYPLFSFANAWEVILEPGDVFWNPPYMWHCVTNETPSIGIGYRFNNPWLALKSSATLLGLRAAARNPNIFQSAYYALKKTNLIVSIERSRDSEK